MGNNPFLEIDRKMLGDIHTSSEPMDNLTVLCDDFGSRFGGTAGERQAADFFRDKFKEFGLKRPRKEPYRYASWRRGDTTLRTLRAEVAGATLATLVVTLALLLGSSSAFADNAHLAQLDATVTHDIKQCRRLLGDDRSPERTRAALGRLQRLLDNVPDAGIIVPVAAREGTYRSYHSASDVITRFDQLIAEPLMVPLAMIMLEIRSHSPP